jgi:hypothetical protein
LTRDGREASGGIDPQLAARAIAVGIPANCGLKTALLLLWHEGISPF